MKPTDWKLTDTQKSDIRLALHTHRIAPSPEQLAGLYPRVEEACIAWMTDREKAETWRRRPEAELRRQLNDLDRALKALSEPAFLIIGLCESNTCTSKALGASAFWHKLTCDLSDKHKSDEWFSALWIARRLLAEATHIAAQTGGRLVGADTGPTAVYAFASRRGRPDAQENVQLVRGLIEPYQEATGRKASDTLRGPFSDFVAAVFAIVTPNIERTHFRNLIRTALGRNVSRKHRKKA